jgi:flagellar hook-basal body complex protein FliE
LSGGLALSDLIKMLHEERKSLQKKLSGVEKAIVAMSDDVVEDVVKAVTKARKKMSAAPRKKIFAAQKLRWSKLRKA